LIKKKGSSTLPSRRNGSEENKRRVFFLGVWGSEEIKDVSRTEKERKKGTFLKLRDWEKGGTHWGNRIYRGFVEEGGRKKYGRSERRGGCAT